MNCMKWKYFEYIDPVAVDVETVSVNEHLVTKEEDTTEEELPMGVKPEGSNLSSEHIDKIQTFLLKWKQIFSIGQTT